MARTVEVTPWMLARFNTLLHAVLDRAVVVLGAVRGHCLGGGLERACLCHRIFASHDASFGQPEIGLGVFAPAASILLPDRIGRARAEDLCLTGRVVASGRPRGSPAGRPAGARAPVPGRPHADGGRRRGSGGVPGAAAAAVEER
jgi:hypothetical protein